jgi:hypothetical protein
MREGLLTQAMEIPMKRIRIGSTQGTVRPFVPNVGVFDVEDEKADALDHIARALSAIDHNLELMATNSKQQTDLLGRIVVAIAKK